MVCDTSWWHARFGREVLGKSRVKISQKTVTIRQQGAVAKPRVSIFFFKPRQNFLKNGTNFIFDIFQSN
jgi:hypothetical protein